MLINFASFECELNLLTFNHFYFNFIVFVKMIYNKCCCCLYFKSYYVIRYEIIFFLNILLKIMLNLFFNKKCTFNVIMLKHPTILNPKVGMSIF